MVLKGVAKLFYNRIKENKSTIDDVPLHWKDTVAAALKEDEEAASK